jgi:SET domain-containing protein
MQNNDVTKVNPEFQSAVTYWLCSNLAFFDSDLKVQQTTLPNCEFLGLFANKHFPKGSVVCVYSGVVLKTREALRLEDKSYLMRLGEQCYVDARDSFDVLARYIPSSSLISFVLIRLFFARYINDCISPQFWNVRFDKRPAEKCAFVVAIQDIFPGDEIFVDYGRWYWAGKKPSKILH